MNLVDTSFNHNGDPIVCSPKNAIESIAKNNADFLMINNFEISNV
jgi:predicted NodU family carbamoyl transferase